LDGTPNSSHYTLEDLVDLLFQGSCGEWLDHITVDTRLSRWVSNFWIWSSNRMTMIC